MSNDTKLLTQDDLNMIRNGNELQLVQGVSRRTFLKYTGGAIACVSLGPLVSGCGNSQAAIQHYPIDPNVKTTLDRMITFQTPSLGQTPGGGTGLQKYQLNQVAHYDTLGYGAWSFGSPLPMVQRTDLIPGYSNPTPTRITRFLNFFSFSDIHITDKEAPNQMMALQQLPPNVDPNSSGVTGVYAPVMLYTTHVLDAAVQTVNALHAKNPFDFGISLGDACDSTRYNELRWYLDVIDGKVITPSSGAHLGADTIDYQRPYKAAGLNPSIPWYQTLGNHDHFYTGSFVVDETIRESYVSGNIWTIGDALMPDPTIFATPPHFYPVLFSVDNLLNNPNPPYYYGGTINGADQYGAVIDAGPTGQFTTPPVVAADQNRRSLLRSEWIREFFTTSTQPVGHGFNLVDPTQVDGFACYSFLPKSSIPIKVIVLDDTQSETDGSKDIHGHGYLDANRWAWLQAELAAGQAANQLMIIAAHVPIGVAAVASDMEWWQGEPATTAQNQNAVDLAGLVQTLWNTPNLLMWISGHRHLNTVKAFPSPNKATTPEQGFWQVETSSLRDFPQQFRTFEIFLNSDYTVSIVTTNVDPSVAEGTPAATSRNYAISQWQITQPYSQTNPFANAPNVLKAGGAIPVPSMDPSRPQKDPVPADPNLDPTIKYTDLSNAGVPLNGSCNVELFKQLSPTMIAALKARFPTA